MCYSQKVKLKLNPIVPHVRYSLTGESVGTQTGNFSNLNPVSWSRCPNWYESTHPHNKMQVNRCKHHRDNSSSTRCIAKFPMWSYPATLSLKSYLQGAYVCWIGSHYRGPLSNLTKFSLSQSDRSRGRYTLRCTYIRTYICTYVRTYVRMFTAACVCVHVSKS